MTNLHNTVNTELFLNGASKPLKYLMEVPELGGSPEKIEITSLSDTSKRYMPGIKDFGDLTFKFLYEDTDTGNYASLKTLETAATAATFELRYPDNTTHFFKAIPVVKMDAATVNGAMSFTASMMMQSDVYDTEAALTAAVNPA